MTTQPPVGPLDSESMKLLVKGDVLRVVDPRAVLDLNAVEVFECEGHPDGFIKLMRKASHFRATRFTFIGRPDADGWMPWGGGENPVPRMVVEYRVRSGSTWALPQQVPSEALRGWVHAGFSGDIIAFRLSSQAGEGAASEAGPAETEIGRAVYERIETLLKTDPRGAELEYLSHLAGSVEEVGGYDGPLAPFAETWTPPTDPRLDRAIEALEPFAAMSDVGDQRPSDDAVWAGQGGKHITFGDFRRARQALASIRGEA